MIDERHEELASLYALDLLEGAERAQFESLLANDPALRKLVEQLRETSSALAHTAPAATVPAGLKARVLNSLEQGAASREPSDGKRIPFPFVPWAIAAGFAVLAGWMGVRYFAVRSEATLLQDQARMAMTTLELERARHDTNRLLAETHIAQLTAEMKAQGDLANLKISALVSLAKNSPEAVAVAVWNPTKQEGLFSMQKAPPLEPTHNLELWVIEDRPGAKPISAGVFSPGADGLAKHAFKPVTPVTAVTTMVSFAVTREVKDGARFHAAPGGEVVMSGASN